MTAAVVALTLLAALAVFQGLLVAGQPLGRFAWGGQHEVLPPNLRIGSAVSIALYAAFAVLILQAAGVISAAAGRRRGGRDLGADRLLRPRDRR